MFRSWRLGRVFGIDLFVHWSFLIIPLMAWMQHSDGGTRAGLLAVSVVLCAFGCVILHELGHALMARVFGIPTRDITLYPIGGVARLERMGDHPGQEFLIAVAGPAVNVAIAAGLWLGMKAASLPITLNVLLYGTFVQGLLIQLLFANVFLVLFNMLPVFPMDGGRVLRSLLSLAVTRVRATEIATGIGTVLCIVFIIGGVLSANISLSLIGGFIMLVGWQELAVVKMQEWQKQPYVAPAHWGIPVDDRMYRGRPSDEQFSGYTWDDHHRLWIEWRNGHPVSATAAGPGAV